MDRAGSGSRRGRQKTAATAHDLWGRHGAEGVLITPVGVCGIYPPRRSDTPSRRAFRRKARSIHKRRFAWERRWRFEPSICQR